MRICIELQIIIFKGLVKSYNKVVMYNKFRSNWSQIAAIEALCNGYINGFFLLLSSIQFLGGTSTTPIPVKIPKVGDHIPNFNLWLLFVVSQHMITSQKLVGQWRFCPTIMAWNPHVLFIHRKWTVTWGRVRKDKRL